MGPPRHHKPAHGMAHRRSGRSHVPNSFCFASRITESFLIVSSEYTTPVGLCGVFTITALVFGVIFCSNSARFGLEGCGIRRDFHKDTIIIADICTVFQKIWCKNDHLFSRVQDCFQDHIQPACSTDGHDQILCGKFRIETSVEGFCDSLAYILKAALLIYP